MSSSKRKHQTPPPNTSSPKKRKHKHKLLHSSKKEKTVTAGAKTVTPLSLFQKSRLKFHIAVPPAASDSLDMFLHTHLTSALLLKHTQNGTIVAFSGFKSVFGAGTIRDECPFSWSWFEGDVVLFNPRIGQRISISRTKHLVDLGGIVALSSPDHIALISHALFNVSIPRTELPEDWNFNDDAWYCSDGAKIEGNLEFEVIQYDPCLLRLTVGW